MTKQQQQYNFNRTHNKKETVQPRITLDRTTFHREQYLNRSLLF